MLRRSGGIGGGATGHHAAVKQVQIPINCDSEVALALYSTLGSGGGC